MHNQPSNDTLLAGDISYMVPEGASVLYQGTCFKKKPEGEVFFTYPSAALPRFIIPEDDIAGQRFVARMLISNRGIISTLFEIVLSLPGGLAVFRKLFFRECVVIAKHD